MADTKLTGLDAVTSLNDADLIYAVTDVATTPLSKKITVANAKTSILSGHTQNASTILIPNGVGTPSFDDMQDFLQETRSAGRISGGVVTAHAGPNGTVDISEMEGMIFTTNALGGNYIFFKQAAATTGLALTDLSVNWIYFDWNAGSPRYLATTDRSTINEYNQFTVGRAWRNGNTVEVQATGHSLYNKDRRAHNRLILKYGNMDRASGANLSQHATALRIQTDAGNWYVANTPYKTSAKNTFHVIYKTGGGAWTESGDITLFSDIFDGGTSKVYETYQNGTSLGTLGANKYGVYWVYICPEGELYVVLGTASYDNVGQAQAASVPASLPPYCVNWATLCGKVICQKTAAALYSVESSFSTRFTLSSAVDHSSLTNLAFTSSGHTGTASTIAGFAAATGAAAEYTLSGTGTVLATNTSPSFTTPTLGVAIGTSLALGGATIGANALAITGTTTQSALAEINLNTVAGPASLTGTALRIVGADNTAVRIGMSSFGIAGLNAFACRHARNTAASPQAVQSGDQLFSLEGWGYGATGYSVAPRVMVRGYASQTWDDVKQSSYLSLWTTPTDSIVPAERMRINQDGTITTYIGIVPDANDGAYLGTATESFSDLFLASGAVINFVNGASTITHSANTLTIGGSGATTLALGANSLTMTGSLAATGARVTKGWFTDIESTNMPTVGGTAILTSLTAPQFTTIELGHASANTLSASGGVLSIEGTAIPKGTGTANEIAYWSGTNTLGTLAVATYPSLTELSYVKGASSALQTQITARATSASPTFTGTITISDNTRIDLTLPTADTYCTGNTTDSFASGYSSAAGDLVFFGSGGKWLEVDADAVATCKGMIGIALEAKNDTEAMKVALPGSFVRFDAWNWTVGATLYAGETLGAMQETIPTGADAIIKVVGFAVNADTIFFNPSSDQQSCVA